MDILYKEVDFWKYCDKCEHKDKASDAEPCNECLEHPCNIFSRKPVNYKPKEK